MKRRASVLVAALAVALLAVTTADAAVFFAGKFDEDGAFIPNEDVRGPCFGVEYCAITAEITDGAARTKIEADITGPGRGQHVETVCLVPLPADVERDGMTWSLVSADVNHGPIPPKHLSAAEAQAVYEAIAKGIGSAHVMALSGKPAVMFTGFPLGGKAKLTLSFSQSVDATKGLCAYECPVPESGLSIGPVGRLTLTASVRDAKPLRSVFSPSHPAEIERDGLHEATVRVAADNWLGGGAFKLIYVADEGPLGLRVLAHRGDGENEGYFMLIGNPTGSPEGEKGIEKDVLFVLDASGSMRGEKMEQARSAIEYCLKNLNPGDRFNVITFGTEVHSFREDLVVNTKAALEAAGDFLDEIVALGRTNIGGALATGLTGQPKKGRPRIMIFLTDGTPTAGERVPDKIVESISEWNTSETRVFVLGVGHDVNAHLLDRLAEETDGSSEYVGPEEEIDVKVAALYDRLSHPVLMNVRVAFGDLMTHSVYPKEIPALFRGSQFMLSGRYREGGTHTVTISGVLAGEEKAYTCTADFPEAAAPENAYVAPLWAARKIGYLLQEVRLHGEDKELIEEIVRLSTQFGIVTEYTEFIATASEPMSREEAVARATKRMKQANDESSGQWAVAQAENDRALQERQNMSLAANTYRDRLGRVQVVDNVRQIGRRAFYKKDGQWVDAEDAGDRKVRTIKAFSDEYFELARENDDFRRAQALGGKLSINIDNERVVVE